MIEDVYEPLAQYAKNFGEKFAELAYAKFKEFTEKSGIDVLANRRLVAEISKLTNKAESAKTTRILIAILIALALCAAIGAAFYAYNTPSEDDRYAGIAITCTSLLIMIPSIRKYSKLSKEIDGLIFEIKHKISEAWSQMRTLNDMYAWDTTVKLMEATVPRLEFDPYFSAQRLEDLKRLYGWNDDFNADKSMTFAQSGEINGNPFVFGEYLKMKWGQKTYVGYKTIYWTESVVGSDGKRHSVTRSQTLSASVTKPIPEYSSEKFLIYGNDAAPNLNFSRTPSSLSNADDGLFSTLRKKWTISRLKSYSRNLEDDSDFTLMSNQEFEALFHATDRDNEVEFRLLFTALAQQQMLLLMKDDKVGYGDDFSFVKCKKINLLMSQHLAQAELDTNPKKFAGWNYDKARDTFMAFNKKYFKDIYFSLAPLLAIPLYQQTKTHENIYKDSREIPSSFWEKESIANFYGDKFFEDSRCITRNILKTRTTGRQGDATEVEVVASGYRGVNHTEHQTVFGGDLKMHTVPVEWVEYLPVERTGHMYISEGRKPPKPDSQPRLRRDIYSYL